MLPAHALTTKIAASVAKMRAKRLTNGTNVMPTPKPSTAQRHAAGTMAMRQSQRAMTPRAHVTATATMPHRVHRALKASAANHAVKTHAAAIVLKAAHRATSTRLALLMVNAIPPALLAITMRPALATATVTTPHHVRLAQKVSAANRVVLNHAAGVALTTAHPAKTVVPPRRVMAKHLTLPHRLANAQYASATASTHAAMRL